MDNLLQLITDLGEKNIPTPELFLMFADSIREQAGACAMAMICTEGLAENEFRVLTYVDKQGNREFAGEDCFSEPSPDSIQACQDRSDLFNPRKPVIRRGTSSGIDPMFDGRFDDFIDAISLPVFQHSGVHRWLLLLFTESNMVDDVDLQRGLELATLAINYVYSIETTRRLSEANAWIERELESVARIKQLLLPQNLDNTPGIRLARWFQPHAYVGGDYYEIIDLNDLAPTESSQSNGAWGFMIADASGHGAAAGVEIAMFDAILRTYQPDHIDFTQPGNVFTYANRYFFSRMLRGGFISAIVCNYQPADQQLNYANAGHPAPIIKRANTGELVVLDDHDDFPLGIERDAQWTSKSVALDPGDLLVLYTDGITETKSADGEEFGTERLHTAIAGTCTTADECLAAIHQAVQDHRGKQPFSDDITLLAIQIEA